MLVNNQMGLLKKSRRILAEMKWLASKSFDRQLVSLPKRPHFGAREDSVETNKKALRQSPVSVHRVRHPVSSNFLPTLVRPAGYQDFSAEICFEKPIHAA